jgi:hypothetical protein
LFRPMYSILLPIPHADKLQMEKLLDKEVGLGHADPWRNITIRLERGKPLRSNLGQRRQQRARRLFW